MDKKRIMKRTCKVAGAVLVDIGNGVILGFGTALIYLGAKEKNAEAVLCGSSMIAASMYAYYERQKDIYETGNYGLERR